MTGVRGDPYFPLEELRPDEIAARPFSRTLLGFHPQEVREFLQEVATALSRTFSDLHLAIQERNQLELSLRDATAKAEELEKQRAATHAQLAAHQELESRVQRAVVDAEGVAAEVTRAAQARADDTVAAADRAAADTRREAREAAAQILRDARALAEQTIRASEKAAAERLAQARMDADWMTERARKAAVKARAHVETFVSDWYDVSQRLETLVEGHVSVLQAMRGVQARLREELLPAIKTMLEASRVDPAADAGAVPPHAAGDVIPRRVPEASRAHPEEPPQRALGATVEAQIIVRPVHSYLHVTELFTAISRLRGVKAARIGAFSKGTATIEVTLEGASLADLDIERLKIFPMDVQEITPTRMVVRVLTEAQ